MALKSWNREHFGVVKTEIQLLSNNLVFIQQTTPSFQTWEAEKILQVELAEVLKREECL